MLVKHRAMKNGAWHCNKEKKTVGGININSRTIVWFLIDLF